MPASLLPDDLPRIAEFLGEKLNGEFLQKYFDASTGPRVRSRGPQGDQILDVPTIVPRLTSDGCVFLKDEKCSIHPVAPFACAYFDTHMSADEGQKRGLWQIKEIAQAHNQRSQYSRSIVYLAKNDHIAKSLRERNEDTARLMANYERNPANG